MITNGGNTEGLFRAAFMQSGAPIPVGDITNGQKYYDNMVKDTGCSGAIDTLQCLRTVPYAKIKAAINNAPSIFAYQVVSVLKSVNDLNAESSCSLSPSHGFQGPTASS